MADPFEIDWEKRPLTKKERDFIDLRSNPKRRAEWLQWTADCLERWKAAHPPKETKR